MAPHRRIANFEIVERRPDVLVIRDLGPWDQFQTVTNAAESVILSLQATGDLHVGQRLLYHDSEGELAELLVDEDGRFAGFKPV